jgi:hypothetical protein
MEILNNLGLFLQSRSKITAGMGDLTRAVDIAKEVLDQTDIAHHV